MSVDAFAQESTCARVKIEIAQELTLERQAFDAHMRIHNGMDGVRLENVGVEVLFFDREYPFSPRAFRPVEFAGHP